MGGGVVPGAGGGAGVAAGALAAGAGGGVCATACPHTARHESASRTVAAQAERIVFSIFSPLDRPRCGVGIVHDEECDGAGEVLAVGARWPPPARAGA